MQYQNVAEDTKIEYSVRNNTLKENIIVTSPQQEYVYNFIVKTEGLELTIKTDGSIIAVTESGKEKFMIPAPYMLDANGQYSDAVYYELSEKVDHYELTVVADENWINDNAVFPVTIDPIVESITNKTTTFANVFENGSKITTGTEVYVGRKNGAERSNAYIRYEIGSYGSNYTLVNANINFSHYTQGMGIFSSKNIKYSASLVESDKTISEITYANKPARIQYLSTEGANVNLAPTRGNYNYDINVGNIKNDIVMIGFECETDNSNGGYVVLYTSGQYSMYLTLTYKLISGIEDEYSMEEFKIGNAAAYVNNASGFLTLNCNFTSINTQSTYPFIASLIYNSCYNDIFDELGIVKMFGNHFKLNFQQYVRLVNNVYYYYDADGSVTSFYYDAGYSAYRAKTKNMTLAANGTQVTIFDAQDNELIFTNGRLTQIVRAANPLTGSIKVSYSSGDKISEVGLYPYNGSTATHKITFTYSGDRVTTVKTYKSSTVLQTYTLQYDSNGNLTEIKNSNANSYVFQFKYWNLEGTPIEAVFNHKKDGLFFSYPRYSDKIWKVYTAKGDDLEELRLYGYAEFNYDAYSVTTIKYYDNRYLVASKSVCFNATREVISEWTEDKNGQVHVSNPGNWKQSDASDFWSDFKKTDISFTEDVNTSVKQSTLSAGQSVTGTIYALSVPTSPNVSYAYALNFKVKGTYGIDITVSVGGIKQNVFLKSSGELYVSVPCNYISSGTFTIKNNKTSNGTTYISNVGYNAVSRVQTIRSLEGSHYNAYRIKEITLTTDYGDYVKNSYDEYQRLSKKEVKKSDNPVLETTTYTYYAPDASVRTDLSSSTTKREGSTIQSVQYAYISSGTYQHSLSSITTTSDAYTMKQSFSYSTDSVTETNENGITTIKRYAISGGDLRLTELECGNRLEKYTYNYFGDITSTKVYNKSTGVLVLTQTNSYSGGLLSSVSFGGNTFSNTYDVSGTVTDIKHNGTTMLHYDYLEPTVNDDFHALQSKTYANGQLEEYDYNLNTVQISHKNSSEEIDAQSIYTYMRDSKGQISQTNYIKNNDVELKYEYGDVSNLDVSIKVSGNLNYDMNYSVDLNNERSRINSTNLSFLRDGTKISDFSNVYSYNSKNQITGNTFGNYSSQLTYDEMNRLSSYIMKYNGNIVNNKTYTFTMSKEGYNTWMISSIQDNKNANHVTSTYYDDGNVKSISYNGNTYTYTYDAAGRLLTENSQNITTAYTYNASNVMLSKNVGGKSINYTHDMIGRITEYVENGKTKYFAYDTMGNPIKYKVSALTEEDNFTWTQGRKLASGTLNGNTFAYEYDPNGIRYKKTVNGLTTEYYLNGDQILAENRIGNGGMIYYIYDPTGIAGMIYNNAYYYFDKNTLGDIIRIRNASGTTVATYNYDAWGNATGFGAMYDINPFRYRGYYYDTETGFYYLQTRYYDPETMLFINADNYELIPTLAQYIGQLNLYVYCNNNPVLYTDKTGELSLMGIIGAVLGVVLFGGTISGIFAVITRAPEEKAWAAFIGGFINGVISSFSIAFGVAIQTTAGPFIAIAGGIIGGVLGSIVSQKLSYGDINWWSVAFSGIFNGMVTGMTAYAFWGQGIIVGKTFGSRFLEMLQPSMIATAINLFFVSMMPNWNDIRNDYENTDIAKYYIVGEY